jgi:hypothetical protein
VDGKRAQELARATDERLALAIFIRTGRFADEHQFRIGIADPENGLGSRTREMWTEATNRNALRDRSKPR